MNKVKFQITDKHGPKEKFTANVDGIPGIGQTFDFGSQSYRVEQVHWAADPTQGHFAPTVTLR